MNGIVYEILLTKDLEFRFVPRTIALSFEDALDRKQLLLNHDGNEDSVYVVEVEEKENNDAYNN